MPYHRSSMWLASQRGPCLAAWTTAAVGGPRMRASLGHAAWAVPRALLHRSSHFTPRRAVMLSRPPPPRHGAALTATPVDALMEEVRLHVPATFTSVQQMSRQIPAEVMERVCDPACGGLRQLLSRYTEHFEVKMIGQVHVARSRHRRGATAEPPHQMCTTAASAVTHLHTPPASRLRGGDTTSTDGRLSPAAVLAELRQLFPTYLVPVKAVWETVAEADEPQLRRRVLDALRSPQHRAWLSFHEHPTHSAAAGVVSEDHALVHGYVRLRLEPHAWEAEDVVAASPAPSPALRMAVHEVQPYEWYRVARVLPTAMTEVLLSSALQAAATLLLPPGRDVWHVLWSCPALFEVRYAPGEASAVAPQPTTDKPASSSSTAGLPGTVAGANPTSSSPPSVAVYVRFRLEERYLPGDMAGVHEAGLLRELESLAADRSANACGLTTRQRRRKRIVQRQLAYLRNPTPYFDERVLAQHLFDLLPLRDGVHQSALLGSLPQPAVQAFPPNVTKVLQARQDLFRLSDATHGVLVQRADAPVAAQRSTESVTGEEVLQHIFATYSLRSHPCEGTTISRSLPRLPRLIRDRLFSMQDVVAELLCQYPERVEVLEDQLSALLPSPSHPRGAADERALRELKTVRGRRDFLVGFRFVGEWEAKLTDRYTLEQEKERAKAMRARRSAPPRQR